ncbi:F-box domain-containing protein [Favolaschia claudopus]|uniref:F-box domain-containing protein n=1 Tax=Favolaschia claudopus TaxID=2862362 RepID=A0AAW0E270_9AGAR
MLESLEIGRTLIAQNNVEILDLQTEVHALRMAKEPVQKRLDSYKYPVLTLPSEIVAEVFLRFLPVYPNTPSLTGLYSPFVLTHICHRWREIACTTPELWRAIDLSYFPAARKNFCVASAPSLAPLWLERSGSLPLSFHYDCDNESADAALDSSPRILSTLIQYRARWEHVRFYLSGVGQLNLINGPMPMLHTLDLWVKSRRHSAESTGKLLPFQSQDLPLLRSFKLGGWESVGITLPWSHLTSLQLDRMHAADYVPILKQATLLVNLTLDVHGPEVQLSRDADVQLLHLQSLTSVPYLDCNPNLIKIFVTPALVSLRLGESLLGSSDSQCIESLKAFISKSGCQLQKLQIISARTSMKAYHEAFPSIPSFDVDAYEPRD